MGIPKHMCFPGVSMLAALAVAVGAAAVTAWPARQLLQTPAHAVTLQEARQVRLPEHQTGVIGAAGDVLKWRRTIPLGTKRVFDCELRQNSGEARRVRGRDRIAARWAPLRHRCHAWRWGNTDPSSGDIQTRELAQAAEQSRKFARYHNVSLAFRVCFGSEAAAWASQPWVDRQSLGWHNETLDETHPNGSVTLHYVNGTGGRAAAVRCDCGNGPPEMVNWDVRNKGFFHSLVVVLPSCCLFQQANGQKMPVEQVFRRLTSPLNHLPCYLHRQGPWLYQLCVSNYTLTRLHAPLGFTDPVATQKKDAPNTRRRVSSAAGTIDGDEREDPRGDKGEATDTREVVTMLLGAGTEAIHLVHARSVGGESFEDGDWEDTHGSGDGVDRSGTHSIPDSKTAIQNAWTAALRAAISKAPRRHRAVEVRFGRGDVCSTSRAGGMRHHRVSVRWVCPASWRSASPERDGGHTSLIAVERPSRCAWVAWVASLLVCADERLLPSPVEPTRQIICRHQNEESAPRVSDALLPLGSDRSKPQQTPGHQRSLAKRDSAIKSTAHHEQASDLGRAGGAFQIGQVVHNLVDGTHAVVVGWDGHLHTQDPSANRRFPLDNVPHYLVLLSAGELPALGALPSGSFGIPGRLASVPQTALRAWHGVWGAPPPVRLPHAVQGRYFVVYNRSEMRFVPTKALLGEHIDHDDVERKGGKVVSADGADTHGGVDDLHSAAGSLELRIKERRSMAAAQLAKELAVKRDELTEKLEALKNLQTRLASLKAQATAAAAASGHHAAQNRGITETS